MSLQRKRLERCRVGFNLSAFFAMGNRRTVVFAMCMSAIALVCFGRIVKSNIGAKGIEYTEDVDPMIHTAADYIHVGSYDNAEASGSTKLSFAKGSAFNSIRIYSHTLSAEEVAYNHSIDKARFGL